MQRPTSVLLAAVAVVALAGCTGDEDVVGDEQPPAVLEETAEEGISLIRLTADAARRLDIQTDAVTTADGPRDHVVPSAAVLIDPVGTYWVYTNPEPLAYVRMALAETWEDGDQTWFADGPPAGTSVVVTGVPELYGAESGIGK